MMVSENFITKSEFDTVDGLIIFHHEWQALKSCAGSFRSVYPEGQLFIARDDIPMKHHNRLAEYAPKFINTFSTTQFFINMKFNNENLQDVTNEEFVSKVSQDLARMEETLSQCKNKYLLYLEADSKVISKTIIEREFDMDSLIANPYPDKVLQLIKQFSNKDLPISGWGFVTGLIKVSSAVRMVEWARRNQVLLLDFFNLDRRFIYFDYFAPILMHLSGGIVINSGHVGECLRDKSWRNKKYTMLHQYRLDYKK
jgi:hypothetical protein